MSDAQLPIVKPHIPLTRSEFILACERVSNDLTHAKAEERKIRNRVKELDLFKLALAEASCGVKSFFIRGKTDPQRVFVTEFTRADIAGRRRGSNSFPRIALEEVRREVCPSCDVPMPILERSTTGIFGDCSEQIIRTYVCCFTCQTLSQIGEPRSKVLDVFYK